MVGLYKDPKGEDIFRKSSIPSQTQSVSSENYQSEVVVLRRRIKELEDEVKEKKVG